MVGRFPRLDQNSKNSNLRKLTFGCSILSLAHQIATSFALCGIVCEGGVFVTSIAQSFATNVMRHRRLPERNGHAISDVAGADRLRNLGGCRGEMAMQLWALPGRNGYATLEVAGAEGLCNRDGSM